MNIKEFTESIYEHFLNGVFYNGITHYEVPVKIDIISDNTLLVEFFNPKDTFMVQVSKRENNEKG